MTDVLLFEITADDVARLDDATFQLVWDALGVVVRARIPYLAAELEPVQAGPAAPKIAGSVAAPAKPAAPSVWAGPEHANQPRTCEGCGRSFPNGIGRHRAFCPKLREAAALPAKTSTNGAARPDFAGRTKAAADRTWQERHPAEVPS